MNNFLGPVGDCGSAKYTLLSPKPKRYHSDIGFGGPGTEMTEPKRYEMNGTVTEDTVRPLIKRGEHEETPGFQNFAVF